MYSLCSACEKIININRTIEPRGEKSATGTGNLPDSYSWLVSEHVSHLQVSTVRKMERPVLGRRVCSCTPIRSFFTALASPAWADEQQLEDIHSNGQFCGHSYSVRSGAVRNAGGFRTTSHLHINMHPSAASHAAHKPCTNNC